MEKLIEFGFDLFNSFGFMVDFLATPFSVPVIVSWAGLVPVIVIRTFTPGSLIVGGGLVVVLTVKIYKFVKDLIPFV